MNHIFELYKTKFRGRTIDNNSVVEGDLIRKSSRSGGSYHYIYVDGIDLEDESKEYLVDASTVELIMGNLEFKQK